MEENSFYIDIYLYFDYICIGKLKVKDQG